jgi:hypothetical protein
VHTARGPAGGRHWQHDTRVRGPRPWPKFMGPRALPLAGQWQGVARLRKWLGPQLARTGVVAAAMGTSIAMARPGMSLSVSYHPGLAAEAEWALTHVQF